MKNPPRIIDLQDGHSIEVHPPSTGHATVLKILPSPDATKKKGTHSATVELTRMELHTLYHAIGTNFADMDAEPLDTKPAAE